MGFISLKNDFSFKHVMRNEEVRKHFVGDVLGMLPEEIRSVRLANTFLWKRHRLQKQGILDLLLDLNDDRKVNIEHQIRMVKYWDRRVLFYLAKMFTEDLLIGENYTKLKKCVSISILDFDLDNGEKYHRVYRLREKGGEEFSDLFEVHIIELRKKLEGNGRIDDWIRLMNTESEEDLDMIKTDNPGILEAVREMKRMGLGRRLHLLYEAHMKEIRDRNARDDFVRDEGIAIGEARGEARGIAVGEARGEARGIAIGEARGEARKLVTLTRKKMEKQLSAEEIAEQLEEETSLVTFICDTIKAHPKWSDDEICRQIFTK